MLKRGKSRSPRLAERSWRRPATSATGAQMSARETQTKYESSENGKNSPYNWTDRVRHDQNCFYVIVTNLLYTEVHVI